MRNPVARRASALLLAVLLAGLSPPRAAEAAISEAQARQMIEQQYGVRVLKLQKGTLDGKAVYFLTVMSPAAAGDSAFMVNRLAVDTATGKLVSGFRHRPSGYDSAGGADSHDTNRQPTDALRQGWNWR